MRGYRSSPNVAPAIALAFSLVAASCAAPNDTPSGHDGNVAIEGVGAFTDTRPWAHDGHAVGEVDVEGGRRADGNATVGGDGSAIVLAPLSAQEIEAAALSGELGCSFAGEAGTGPLLLAMGDVASKMPARGVVKVGDHVEAVAASGGFDGMLRGARFSGAGKTVDVEVSGAAAGGGESPAHPATLTYHRADGAQRRWTGWWQCGP